MEGEARWSVSPWVLFYGRGKKGYSRNMKRDDAIARLRAHETEFRRLGVERLFLFGSTARDEAREDSDVDLFFDHPEGSLGLFELMDLKARAAEILGRRADVMTRRSLHERLRPAIEATAVVVF